MKRIFAILISLLFVASVFGVALTMAKDPATATPDKVKVGELITVISPSDPCYEGTCYDPDVKIYNDSLIPRLYQVDDPIYGNLKDASSYVVKVSGPVEVEGKFIWIWTYRAVHPGKIVFGARYNLAIDPKNRNVTNPVTITKASYPMNSFMKILGFGNKD